jgi:hypothetical protein
MGKEFALALALIFHIPALNRIIRIDLTVGLHPAGCDYSPSAALCISFPMQHENDLNLLQRRHKTTRHKTT